MLSASLAAVAGWSTQTPAAIVRVAGKGFDMSNDYTSEQIKQLQTGLDFHARQLSTLSLKVASLEQSKTNKHIDSLDNMELLTMATKADERREWLKLVLKIAKQGKSNDGVPALPWIIAFIESIDFNK